MKKTLISRAGTAVATLVLGLATVAGPFGLASAGAVGENSAGGYQYKPGIPSNSPILPASATLTDGSPHPCAGKPIVSRVHVDAAYATFDEQRRLVMRVVDGSEVRPADAICMRLAPDAITANGPRGDEASRMVVTPAFPFLGNPGDLLWVAPQLDYGSQQPLWAGAGAFDHQHDSEVPRTLNGKVTIRMEQVQGPGRVEVFTNHGPNLGARIFSSSDPDFAEFPFDVDSHAHMNWTFSAPGIYRITMSATYIDPNFTPVTAAPVTYTWLVGPDEAVSLPQRFTPRDTITRTAEQIRDAYLAQLPPSEATPADPAPGAQPDPQPAEPLRTYEKDGQTCRVYPANSAPGGPAADGPATVSAQALQTYIAERQWNEYPRAVQAATGNVSFLSHSDQVDAFWGDPLPFRYAGAAHEGGAIIIEVPDRTLTRLEASAPAAMRAAATNNWVWHAGVGGAASLSFDATDLPDSDGTPARFSLEEAQGPQAGARIFGLSAGRIVLDSAPGSGAVMPVAAGTSAVADLYFSHPGFYQTELVSRYFRTSGGDRYTGARIYFAVGNDAINAARALRKPPVEPLPSAATETVEVCEPAANPAPGGEQPPSEPAKPGSDLEYPLGMRVEALIRSGHMDLANAPEGAAVHDGATPGKLVKRPSGSVVFAVPRARLDAPLNLGEAGYSPDYLLPEVQEANLPWVGFSTHFNPERTTDIRIKRFAGPGRMITGHFNLMGFSRALDSANPDQAYTFPPNSHDHQLFAFDQPGRYAVEFEYTTQTESGPVARTLLVGFAVGEAEIEQAAAAIGGGAGAPAEQPSEKPSEKPGEKPADPAKPGGWAEATDPVDGDDEYVTDPDILSPFKVLDGPDNPVPGQGAAAAAAAPGAGPAAGAANPSSQAPVAAAPVINATPAFGLGSGGIIGSLGGAALPADAAGAGADIPAAAEGAVTQTDPQLSQPGEGSANGSFPTAASAPVGAGMTQNSSWVSGFLMGVGAMALLAGGGAVVAALVRRRQIAD